MTRVSIGAAARLPATLRLRESVAFALKVSRPGMWLTAVWFYLLPLGGRDVFHRPEFWLGVVYITFPLGYFLCGWNDLTDTQVDSGNRRKDSYLFGARGTPAQLATLPASIALVQAPFVVLFTMLLGPRMLWWLAAWAVACAFYNSPGFEWKARAPLDLLIQPTFLLMFLFSSWLNQVPQLPWPAFVFGALFAIHGHLLQEIMDIEPDRCVGRRTTAIVLGHVRSKLLLAVLMAAEAALLVAYFGEKVMGSFFAAASLIAIADAAFWRDRPYGPAALRHFMLAWNLLALASMPWVWGTARLTRLA
ncbi:MAG: UbiA family prenyltransferase [Acidobacteria bacterium]|nr:UbiA family prenyltransferase [Acidobacteriota bacterium]